ncbi:hypothetical protein CEUSTIGMA_g2147.t1 [Chlamydomonas eustigma]|uniref:C3H1-type domain-containing protein n=1 Tax=Chlamydomonas eustigma TaxID=1157962 RepID=A0A250WVG7_9CHLO|nr:hypothetical protein CEUSTIGMA_g2147.t1 [Chlamydomonas eustigma]|eukprot:GAX74699.1 hypothetical protein CEUSTIGMA_g2147.t1 [Chlamydomonas eustigma]
MTDNILGIEYDEEEDLDPKEASGVPNRQPDSMCPANGDTLNSLTEAPRLSDVPSERGQRRRHEDTSPNSEGRIYDEHERIKRSSVTSRPEIARRSPDYEPRHGRDMERGRGESPRPEHQGREPLPNCRYFMLGKCRAGDSCRFPHALEGGVPPRPRNSRDSRENREYEGRGDRYREYTSHSDRHRHPDYPDRRNGQDHGRGDAPRRGGRNDDFDHGQQQRPRHYNEGEYPGRLHSESESLRPITKHTGTPPSHAEQEGGGTDKPDLEERFDKQRGWTQHDARDDHSHRSGRNKEEAMAPRESKRGEPLLEGQTSERRGREYEEEVHFSSRSHSHDPVSRKGHSGQRHYDMDGHERRGSWLMESGDGRGYLGDESTDKQRNSRTTGGALSTDKDEGYARDRKRSDDTRHQHERRSGEQYRGSGEQYRGSYQRPSAGKRGGEELEGPPERSRRSSVPHQTLPGVPGADGDRGNSADIVKAMMAGPRGTSGAGGAALAAGATGGAPQLSRDQKVKLLWGSKKAEPLEVLAAPPGDIPVNAVFGHNRWDAAEFTSDKDKERFQRLMGIKGEVAAALAPILQPPGADPEAGQTAMRREEQERVLNSVEVAFHAGLKRADGRTVGLGAER